MDKFRIRKISGRAARRLVMLAVLLLWLGSRGAVVYAVPAAAESGAFGIEAVLAPGGGGNTYDIRVTVQNSGADWEGTVRLSVEERYDAVCAYDTELALPEGSKKQFTVRIPVDSMEDRRGTLQIELLDKKGNQVGGREFARFFLGDAVDALSMGILSDDYTALTYLDMGGQEMYFYSDRYPVKLVELDRDNLEEYLDSLVFLVIDRYSTEALTEEQVDAIWRWVWEDGGILIVGTGAYAEETLGGFEGDDIGVKSLAVYPPGEPRPAAGSQGAAGYSSDQALLQAEGLTIYMNTDQITLAALEATRWDLEATYFSGGYAQALGMGAAAVLPFSLSELGSLDEDAFHGGGRTVYLASMLDEISDFSQMRYVGDSYYYKYTYQRSRLFGILGNSDNALNFGALRVIVICYVIFVGPVLYLILKLLKKRELYWAAVPAAAIIGIVLVYVAGRGFEVTNTKVYSVTVEKLADEGEKRTYMQCYDAGHSKWQLKLSGDYEYAGPMESGYYYSADGAYYHVRKAGDELYFGINPEASFENCFVIAGGARASGQQGGVRLENIEASVNVSGLVSSWQGLSGTVSNDTGKDFKCFALIVDDFLFVYGGLPAGESRELAGLEQLYWGPPVYEDSGDYFRQLKSYLARELYVEEIEALAALGIGICGVGDEAVNADVLFMGVTEDYEPAVDDVCDEVSYGCLYVVQ